MKEKEQPAWYFIVALKGGIPTKVSYHLSIVQKKSTIPELQVDLPGQLDSMNDTGYLLAGIGAAGGLLAGLINFVFRPLSEHNRMIWKHIQKTYLIDQTLNNLVFTFGFDQAVRSNLLEPLANLELEVREETQVQSASRLSSTMHIARTY
ncbi:MAG: hypothetical protein IPH00_07435 [Flavobacteriales bacterium]|nr:hypothetical protein [Flavobacteriales bacterium]